MKKIKVLSGILLFVGIISLIYGWSQVWGLGDYSGSYNDVYTLSLIRKYTFLSLGGIMLLISYIIDRFVAEIEKL